MTSSPTPLARPLGAPYAAQHRAVAGALIASPVVVGLALFFVLPVGEAPPAWVPIALVAAGVVAHLLIEAVGYRVPALAPSLDDDAATGLAMVAYQAGMILRFAVAESVAIASIVLAFVLSEGGLSVYAVGAGVSLVLMGIHVWPWARPVGKGADRLEARGKPSRLREIFGHATEGPVQRL